MARIYANENFPLPVVEALRRLGHDVLMTLDAGQAGQALPDEAVLRFAASQDRILLTLNRRHFIRLHEQGPAHAGIIVCTVDPDFAGQAERIDAALQAVMTFLLWAMVARSCTMLADNQSRRCTCR